MSEACEHCALTKQLLREETGRMAGLLLRAEAAEKARERFEAALAQAMLELRKLRSEGP